MEELVEFAEIRLRVRAMDVRVFQSSAVTGPAFLLVHGFGVSSRYFGPLARELSRHGRVLVLDLPGFGSTDDPDHAPRIAGFAHVVNQVIRELSVHDPVLIGHSMGTQVALEALLRAPELSRGAVLAAPVINDRERGAATVLWRFVQSAVKEPPSSAWDSVRGFARSGPRWLLRAFTPMLRYPIEERLKSTHGPVTLVGGLEDRIAPPQWCHRLAEAREGVGVVIVDGAAHEMIHTHAAEVARVAVALARTSQEGLPTPAPAGSITRPSPGLPPCGD